MKAKHMKIMLENIARQAVPDDLNMMPIIAARLERKSVVNTLRTHPGLTLLLVLLMLALLSGAAYAIGWATGFIPGIGLVNQAQPLRVLAEPVAVTRDEITLTIEQAVLSADKTVVVYKIEGISINTNVSEGNEIGNSSYTSVITAPVESETPNVSHTSIEDKNTCFSYERLLLPDGRELPQQSGEISGWIYRFEGRSVFGSIPMDFNEAIFTLSCIPESTPGKLPEDWEVPLHFVPAPPDMTILPVNDIATPVMGNSQAAITLERVIETATGYIVTGKFESSTLPLNAKALGISNWITITDANGQIVEARPPESLDLTSTVYGEFYWAYEIQGKQFAFPLTFTLEAVSADIPDVMAEFDFDMETDPRVGQVWNLDKQVEIAGYTIKVVSIERLEKGYSFIFKADPDVVMVHVEINDFPFSSASGGNDGYGNGDLFYVVEYSGEVPSGKTKIRLNWLQANIHGPWQVQWRP